MIDVLEPRKGLVWHDEALAVIEHLRSTKAFDAPLTEPSCAHDTPPGLVVRTFHFTGKGRDVTLGVKLHAKAMVGLLRAMILAPSIQVTADFESAYSGSYRTWAQQEARYLAYIHGTGYKAANPCYGYHRRGRAVDLFVKTDAELRAMLAVRVDGERFYNGASFGDPPHFTLGALG